MAKIRLEGIRYAVLSAGILIGAILLTAVVFRPSHSVTAQLPPPQLSSRQPQEEASGQRVIDLRETSIPKIGSPAGAINPSDPKASANPAFQERFNEMLPEERIGALIYERRNRSVVNIDTVMVRRGPFMFTEEAEGRGSGVVLSRDGVILTNFHVVEGANAITVTLFNGETYQAVKIGEDANTDIALVKIDAPTESLFPVDFGDSSKLLVGQIVYAIGNPFGHERTMTRGIVSNLNRTINSPQQFRQIKGVIQIDAAINPGNSGGALFDSQGRMIGMNTAIASRVGDFAGIGFAIPVNTIARIASILINDGKVVRGDVGIVQVTETDAGILPMLLDDGGAADRAGLRGTKLVTTVVRQGGVEYRGQQKVKPKGGFDLIVGVNGQHVKSGEEFITLIEEHAPGEKIVLNIVRQGRPMDLPVVLD